jgi:hypothetical protein
MKKELHQPEKRLDEMKNVFKQCGNILFYDGELSNITYESLGLITLYFKIMRPIFV